eukprot:CAMPEP_0119407494 /NCGR_PEP_ID=MMETSP1335-20130426/1358_1 /TAXON_ID=259385 /ORGANISM="Chrysoculter rhomboideus, Strain RCC1486" /LENGTH=165 /DNA_ID=CAMNT_0007431605 /DNA_START=101 /DNA_END=598 /DNA_ORIENTATION=+
MSYNCTVFIRKRGLRTAPPHAADEHSKHRCEGPACQRRTNVEPHGELVQCWGGRSEPRGAERACRDPVLASVAVTAAATRRSSAAFMLVDCSKCTASARQWQAIRAVCVLVWARLAAGCAINTGGNRGEQHVRAIAPAPSQGNQAVRRACVSTPANSEITAGPCM